MTKKDEHLKSLIGQKKYEEIYLQYGASEYRKCTPIFYRLKDIERLLREERYYALYEKHGETVYTFLTPYIKNRDIQNELGYDPLDKKIETFESKLKETALAIALSALILNMTSDGALIAGLNAVNNKDYSSDEKFVQMMTEYDSSIEEYASYINSLGLSDLEVITKVMIDIWANIYGYNGKVEGYSNDINYSRLAIYTYGYGVCRHLADDFTARMNAINPEYKAFNMCVYMQDSFELSNIDRFWFPKDLPNEEADLGLPKPVREFIKSKIGNHMVTCLTIPNTDIHLVVDVTNPSIGVLKNGHIVMLTEKDVDPLVPMHDSNMGYKWKNKEELLRYLEYYLQSFLYSQDLVKLKEKYGTSAQNEAIKKVSVYDTSTYKIDPINTDETPFNGKSPLYYDGYCLTIDDNTIELYKTNLTDVKPLEEVSYRAINNFLRRHPEATRIFISYDDDTIDFSQIDFSVLDNIECFKITCTSSKTSDKVLKLTGSIDKLLVTFDSQKTAEVGQIAVRAENARKMTIMLANGTKSENIAIEANDNADSITISTKDKTDYTIDRHSKQVKIIYSVEGRVIVEELSYEKHLQKVLN